MCGEFASNHLEPENGKKKETFGSLTMYYTEKKEDAYTVTVSHPEAGEDTRDYRYNSATSMFFISINSSEVTNGQYCTFATLNTGSVQRLKDLQKDIEDYIDDENDAKTTEKVRIDADDPVLGDANKTANYTVLKSPVTIKKVTIKSR